MRDQVEIFGLSVWWVVAGLSLAAILTVGALVIYAWSAPQATAIDRAVVEGSKSYNDSGNLALANFIASYEGSRDDNQRKAILHQICVQFGTMQIERVNTVTLSWIKEHGGCR